MADLLIIYNFPVIKGLPVDNDDYGQSHRHSQAHTSEELPQYNNFFLIIVLF